MKELCRCNSGGEFIECLVGIEQLSQHHVRDHQSEWKTEQETINAIQSQIETRIKDQGNLQTALIRSL